MLSKADLIHAWGPVMTISMIKANVDMSRFGLPKIDLVKFKIKTRPIEKFAPLSRVLYCCQNTANIILKSFAILNQKN
jgi:hypothetical protein